MGHSRRFKPIWLALSLASACFDGEELLKDEPCQVDRDCAGNQVCRQGVDEFNAPLGLVCQEPLDPCDPAGSGGGSDGCVETLDAGSATTTAASSASSTSTTSAGTSTTDGTCVGQGASCVNGETCCGGTTCVFYAEGDSRCETTCSLGGECGSCCCVPLQNMSANVCVEASFCSQEQYCGGACASPGAICNSDDDCCDPSPYGASCLLNSGDWYSCFKICSVGTDCVSGCCNYNANSGQYICETC